MAEAWCFVVHGVCACHFIGITKVPFYESLKGGNLKSEYTPTRYS